jgi:hypothetical protein
MPEPTVFLSKQLPAVSIIRPTATEGAALATLKSFILDGLFIGQSHEFLQFVGDLARDADQAQREG